MMRILKSLGTLLLAFMLLPVGSNLAVAGELPGEPLLRINPGEHTATIRRIATDAAGRYLVTASDDKTARVWSLADGRLLNTLRIPIGNGNEGKLFAAALSPDGQTVALGGWTDDANSAYLLDRASGKILRRLTGLPNVVEHFAFSPDGSHLATSLGSKGIRLFSVADGRLVAEDSDYGATSYGLDFNKTGRLVTTSDDGLIRLYRHDGNSLVLLAKRSAPGGKQPFSARFSPDGSRIAVGFSDTSAVNILNSDDLSLNFAPDTQTVDPQKNLSQVAWSQDGRYLYAGGSDSQKVDGRWVNYIRRWPQAGNGAPVDWPVAGDSITGFAPLAGGNLVFGSADPAWGLLDTDGKRQLFHAPVVADFRNNQQGFTLSHDGSKVRFGYDKTRLTTVFDSKSKSFLAENTSGLNPPLSTAQGLEVTDWKNSYSPKLNGKPLKLRDGELSRSMAVLLNGAGLALGTEWRLRLFNQDGSQRWEQYSPSPVWTVNVSQDGRWVVAAYGDGTIRWHRVKDGVEQLAFYPHPDMKRWVLWSPSGYYEASPGAEDLIGWHLNRGANEAADFFPASRFRERYYRPDVLAKVLETQDEAEALRMANQDSGRLQAAAVSIANVLPPVVEIVSPATDSPVSSTTVKVRYNVRTLADAPVTGVRVRVNGQAVSAQRALKPVSTSSDNSGEIEVVIPEQDSEIALFAENKNGVSTAAILRVTWAGQSAAPTELAMFKPKLYVLAVGVSKYKNPDFNLGLAAKDASDFAAALQQQKGKLYGEVVIKLLTDEQATRDDVVDGLDWLRQQVTSRDVGMMFIAGHGMNDNANNYYFLPHNADPDKLMRTGVANADIRTTLGSLAGKAIFFVDTCHAGNALGTSTTRAIGGSTDALVSELASAENGVVVFSSSTGKQLSQENPAWGNGAFTKAVIEGLNGGADYQKTGRITHKMLDLYVAERVKELTAGKQSPVSIAPGGAPDFPIAALGQSAGAAAPASNTRVAFAAPVPVRPAIPAAAIIPASALPSLPSPNSGSSADMRPGVTFKDCPDCPEMVVVPAGNFEMGAFSYAGESPAHQVAIGRAFAMGKTEVTQGQWRAIMGNNPSRNSGCGDDCPVDQVSWHDARKFIEKLNAKTGKQYRLPSEAEWEYACRAGERNDYCGSNTVGNVAWSDDNSGNSPKPAAKKQANAFGLFDMSGNVWEWVEDSYHSNYSGAPADGSAWQGDGAKRVKRGGSWYSSQRNQRATNRNGAAPGEGFNYDGFRLALTLAAPASAPVAQGYVPSIAGTTWAIKDSDGDDYTYAFQNDGTMHYQRLGGELHKDGNWKQDNDKVSFEVNGRYLEREGRIIGDHAEGSGWNRAGQKWTWTARPKN